METIRAHVIVVHPYGHLNEGDEGTKSRCERALALVRSDLIAKYEYRIIITAGYSEVSPNKPTNLVKHSLAEQMKDYFIAYGVPAERIIVPKNTVWGTLNEICKTLDIIDTRHIIPIKIWCVTDQDHMKRVLVVWKGLVPPTWKIEAIASPRFMLAKERMKEIAKRMRYRWKDIPLKKIALARTIKAIERHQKAPA